MKKKIATVLVALAVTVAALVTLTGSANGATTWRTKASSTSKGASYWTTDTTLETVVERPYAARVQFRTLDSKSHRVVYTFDVICDNVSKSGFNRAVYTNANNTWKSVTFYSGSSTLGAFCDVYVSASMNSTARLQTRIQARQR